MLRLFVIATILLSSTCVDPVNAPTRKPSTIVIQAEMCGDTNFRGFCDGASIVWCGADDQLLTVDCWEAGFEGCAFTGELYDCYSFQESFDDCVERVALDCDEDVRSGMCAQSSKPLMCHKQEEAAAAECVEEQIAHGACF